MPIQRPQSFYIETRKFGSNFNFKRVSDLIIIMHWLGDFFSWSVIFHCRWPAPRSNESKYLCKKLFKNVTDKTELTNLLEVSWNPTNVTHDWTLDYQIENISKNWEWIIVIVQLLHFVSSDYLLKIKLVWFFN